MRRPLALYAVAVYAFLHLPLLVLAVFSFNASRFTLWEGFSLRWYNAIFEDRSLLESAFNSLLIAAGATVGATVLGTLAAYALWKRSSTWLSSGLYLSLVTPEIVTGVSLLAFFQWIFRFAHLRLGMHTVILAHVGFCLAYVVVVILSRLRGFDKALEEAALDLGADPFGAFRLVTLPYLSPAIAAAGLLAFTVSIDDYVITSLVAGVSPVLNAVSTLIVVGLGLVVMLSERLQRK